jgi:hypothetical protein
MLIMKNAAMLAHIRQLCCLGLPGELLMGALLPALRELVPSDSAGFFWVDARGDMANLYAERLLPADVMSLYFERYYDGREAAMRMIRVLRAPGPLPTLEVLAKQPRWAWFTVWERCTAELVKLG